VTRTEHLLVILMEECAEVAHRASKALRFGLAEVQPGQPLRNAKRIEHEFIDLVAAWDMLQASHPFDLCGTGEFRVRVETKKAKVEEFLAFSAGLGTVDDRPADPVPHPGAGGLPEAGPKAMLHASTLAEQMAAALRDAHRDIREWVQLAERQRNEIPNAPHCPYAPTDAGVTASRAVLSNISNALARYRRETGGAGA
jgi:hypothetical protein